MLILVAGILILIIEGDDERFAVTTAFRCVFFFSLRIKSKI